MDSKSKIADLLRWVARIAGSFALVLGILFWFGMALPMLRAHSVLGILTAAALALVALVALAAGARAPMAIVAILWAAATVYVGFNQNALLTGSNHWAIQVVHLLLGLGAIGMAEALAGAVRKRSV